MALVECLDCKEVCDYRSPDGPTCHCCLLLEEMEI